MNTIRGWMSGWITAAASLLMILGAVLLSVAEGQVPISPTAVIYPTLPVYDYSFPESPTQAFEVNLVTATQAISTPCVPPGGWSVYRVFPGDTLDSLSRAYQIPVATIMAANCLVGESLPPASLIYLPPVQPSPTATLPAVQPRCGPPTGWVAYRIQPEDNLFRLSRALGISVPELQFANCLGNSTVIITGNYLMVPFIPARTATATLTASATLTPSPTWTFPPASTSTFTPTPSGTPVATQTFTTTLTPSSTSTSTLTPTWTSTPAVPGTETSTLTPSG